ncbi:MAG TPA: metallophosphoesterase [Polyangiaceae bacterium]|nr:metallophosphoesterase [Polyangiaceae bacterium]
MKLYALSDLHVSHPHNRRAFERLGARPDDWLILAGDLCESPDDLAFVFGVATARFAKVFWVPGNHELWSVPKGSARGVARYEALVALCREAGVVSPEDPYVAWPGPGAPCVIAPLFLLYDYSFRPAGVPAEAALDWALEEGLLCTDEALLHADPYPSKAAWCRARCEQTVARLAALDPGCETVLVNHFPLRYDLSSTPAIPRFSIWCGTRRTEDWHRRFRARAVVSGHLHIRATAYRDGVRFEEVSLGYPRQWRAEAGVDAYLREILPGPSP